MRSVRPAIAGMLAVALVVAFVPGAFASGPRVATKPRFSISKPRVAAAKVKTGVAFEASGSVAPTLTADDVVYVQTYSVGRCGLRSLSLTTATVSFNASGTQVYTAGMSGFKSAGVYKLRSVVRRSGKIISSSSVRPMVAYMPYKLTAPRVVRPAVKAGTAFEASGSIVPTLTAEDSVTASLTVKVYRWVRVKRSDKLVLVAQAPATITDGKVYVANVAALTRVGKYRLIAVLTNGAATIGASAPRELQIKRK